MVRRRSCFRLDFNKTGLIAYERLQIRTMVRNRHLAKSIHDAGWGIFLQWLNYYGLLHDIPIIAVAPHYTSQNCSTCSTLVKKSLSMRQLRRLPNLPREP